MSDPDSLLSVTKDNRLDDDSGSWQGGSHHAFNVAYEDLKHRYNDLQERYRAALRQARGSRAGLEDENLFIRVSPSPQHGAGPSNGSPVPLGGTASVSAGGGSSNAIDNHMQVLHLQQTLSLRNREIDDLKLQLDSKNESDKRVLELQKQNDQLMKLNHDLTYNNSEQVSKQLHDVNRQLDMTKAELSVLQKDYNALLQENENLLKKNLLLEQRCREKFDSPEKSLSNGLASPTEQTNGQDNDMDADDLLQMVGMSLSSKDEMARLKETVWKLNEVMRILLRQQNEKPSFPNIPGFGMNGDISSTGQGARPKIKTAVPQVLPNLSRQVTDMVEDVDEMADSLRVRRSQSMQHKKKPKNLELRGRGLESSPPQTRPKSDIEYTRYHVDLDKGKGHVKYTTHIKLHEDITEVELPSNRREKNVYRSVQNRSRPIIDPRKGLQTGVKSGLQTTGLPSELGVSVYDRDDLPVREILTGGRIDDIMEKSFEGNYRSLDSDLLPNSFVKRVTEVSERFDQMEDLESPETDEFLTLTPAEAMQFEPREPPREPPHEIMPQIQPVPQSPSMENRNNRRSQIILNSSSRENGGSPRPLNIDRNECGPSVRSYDNDQGLNVNLNTMKDKFNIAHSTQGFPILNNDPLTGNKTIPSKNIYQEVSDPNRPPPSPRITGRPSRTIRTAQEHDDTTILQPCPICTENFDISLSHTEFETHVDECIARNNAEEDDSIVLREREERMCPMCNRVFSDEIPQSEFEVHVNDHFDLNFEIVASSEA